MLEWSKPKGGNTTLARDAFLFAVTLNLATFILKAGGIIGFNVAGYTSPQSIPGLFTIENINFTTIGVTSIGAIAAGLLAVYTKQYIFGFGVILIWVLSMLLTPIGWLVNGFPMFLQNIILLIGGSSASTLGYIVLWATTSLTVYIIFMFVIELLSGKQIT